MCGGGGCRRLELDVIEINVASERIGRVGIGNRNSDTSERGLRTANLNIF